MAKAVMAATLCLLAGAASAAPGAPPVASCNYAGKGRCVEYRNNSVGSLEAMKSACDRATAAAWADGKGCAAEKRVGHCSRTVLESVTQASFYPPYTSERARAECAATVMQDFQPN